MNSYSPYLLPAESHRSLEFGPTMYGFASTYITASVCHNICTSVEEMAVATASVDDVSRLKGVRTDSFDCLLYRFYYNTLSMNFQKN